MLCCQVNGVPNTMRDESSDCWIRNTSLFREWDAMKQEILKHKWYESEKVGHDIGWDRASVDWLVRYGNKRSQRN